MDPALIERVTQRLMQLQVTLHTRTRIVSIPKHEAVLDNGESVPFDFMVFAGGTESVPALKALNLPKEKNGRFKVDAYLRSLGDSSICFAGDTAILRDRKGAVQPPTAQVAIQSGELIADNILRKQQGRNPKHIYVRIKGLAIALGGPYAIIKTRKLMLWGYTAYLVKKMIEWRYRYPLKHILRRGYSKIRRCTIYTKNR